MTEKQTSPQSPKLEAEILTEDPIDLVTQWEQENAELAAAARRTVDTVPTQREYTDTVTESPFDATPQKPRKAPVGTAFVLTGLTAIAAGGAIGINQGAGGSDQSERGEVDKSVYSFTISPDANIRIDPFVDNSTVVIHPGAEVTITSSGVRVVEGTDNGTWYGFNKADLTTAIPEVADVRDTDDIIWVNEQGIESIDEQQGPSLTSATK